MRLRNDMSNQLIGIILMMYNQSQLNAVDISSSGGKCVRRVPVVMTTRRLKTSRLESHGAAVWLPISLVFPFSYYYYVLFFINILIRPM